jgi:energy-coupling factor transporter ATP-binding protein EcfA2
MPFSPTCGEDADSADQLQRVLEAAGVRVWRDTSDLWAGEDWRQKIRRAITNDAFVFIACFSRTSVTRRVSYQYEEIALAIEQLRSRNPEVPWFIPVRLDDCDIPDLDIGRGRTLRSLQRADVFGDRSDEGAVRLVTAVLRILGRHSDLTQHSRLHFRGDEQVLDEAATEIEAEPRRVRAAVLESARAESSEAQGRSAHISEATGLAGPWGGGARVSARIGMLGPTGCGKTTYLAVLDLALARAPGDWLIRGASEEADDYLNRNVMLLAQRRFPPATMAASRFSFVLTGSTASSVLRAGQPSKPAPMELLLDMMDMSGGLFAEYSRDHPKTHLPLGLFGRYGDEDPYGSVLDYLESCGGLLLLFDPGREDDVGDYYDYLRRALLALSDRSRDRESYLPHRVAVCVTKFDDPFVFRKAAAGRHVQLGDTLSSVPRVSEARSRAFFRDLCTGTNGADLVMALFEHYFHPDRIMYFVTSAIGFYLNPTTGRFDDSDFANVVMEEGGENRIRGRVRPINVVEPLLWLAQLK